MPATLRLVRAGRPPRLRDRALATVARALAARMVRSGPVRLRHRLTRLSRSRRSASFSQVAWSRGAVLAVRRGTPPDGMRLATATCVLCLLRFGTWPTWNADAPGPADGSAPRTADGGRPHAWVSVAGQAVGEHPDAGAAAFSISREGI